MHEVYNSGTLSGQNQTELTIKRRIKEFVNVAEANTISVTVSVTNELGCTESKTINPELEDEAREVFRELENGNEEYLKLWTWFRDESIKEALKLYDMLNVKFDSYTFVAVSIPKYL